MSDKPLFIPLKAEYFYQFKRGEKHVEMRKYGPRWNEKTCKVGREVTLSLGYGKAHRMSGRIVSFSVCDINELQPVNKKIMSIICPSAETIAMIGIECQTHNNFERTYNEECEADQW